MKTLNDISSSQYADNVFNEIDKNFDDVKSAIDTLEQSGGGGGGGGDITPAPSIPYHILWLGNSFQQCTVIGLKYINDLLSSAVKARFGFNYISVAGTGLQTYVNWMNDGSTKSVGYMIGATRLGTANYAQFSGTAESVFSNTGHNWDLIILQELSTSAADYSNYASNLNAILSLIKRVNTTAKIAFMQVWGYGSYPYSGMVGACKDMMDNVGDKIDMLIPVGTAVENIRGTSLNDSSASNFSYDGRHLSRGIGDYSAAAAFYKTVLEPITEVALENIEVTTNESTGSENPGVVNVTSENRATINKAARYALFSPYAKTMIDDFIEP